MQGQSQYQKRRTGSCDACYIKKKKCIPLTDSPAEACSQHTVCRACNHLGISCTYKRLIERKTRTLRYALSRPAQDPDDPDQTGNAIAGPSQSRPQNLLELGNADETSDRTTTISVWNPLKSSTFVETAGCRASAAAADPPFAFAPHVTSAHSGRPLPEGTGHQADNTTSILGSEIGVSPVSSEHRGILSEIMFPHAESSSSTHQSLPSQPPSQAQLSYGGSYADESFAGDASASVHTQFPGLGSTLAPASGQSAFPLVELLTGPPRPFTFADQTLPPEISPSARNHFALPPKPYLQPITVLAPAHVIDSLIDAFFLYLHAINPIVHEPTFREKYRSHEYAHKASFFALTCSIVALTLVQVPRAYLTASDSSIATPEQVSQVATWADSLCREIAMRDGLKQPSLDWLSAKYINALYHLQTGNWTVMNCLLGEAYALCSDLKLDKPSRYAALQPVEVQIARRLVWVLFTSDKMNSLFGNCYSRFHLSFGHIELPQEYSDNQINNSGLPSSNQVISHAMSAFCLGANISRVLDRLLPIMREDALETPHPNRLMGRLAQLEELQDSLRSLLRSAPKRLRLPHGAACDELMGTQVGQETPAGEAHIMSDDEFQQMLNTLLQNDLSDVGTFGRFTWLPTNTEIIAISNLHVSFLVLYMEICRHRRHLLIQLRLPVSTIDDQMITISRALLDILMNVPISAVATNGRSLIRKIQHVVATLNELILAPQAQRMVGEYLNMLAHLTNEYRFEFQQDRPLRSRDA